MNLRRFAVVAGMLGVAVAYAGTTPEACIQSVRLGQGATASPPPDDRVAEYLELHARAVGELPLDGWAALPARPH
jgi:hypothetical protein